MRRDRQFLGAGLIWLAGAASTAGCVDNQEYLVVERTPAWTVESSTQVDDLQVGRCVVDPSVDVSFLHGLLDVGFGTPYTLPFVVENRLLAEVEGTGNSPGVPQGEVQLLDVDVELSMPQAPEMIDALRAVDESLVSFNQPIASVSVPAGSEQGVSVPVISAWAADELRSLLVDGYPSGTRLEVLASIVVNGRRTGSGDRTDEVAAREYTFPIELCNKCLVDCSRCTIGQCPASADPDSAHRFDDPWYGGVCGSAQDFLHIIPASCVEPEE